MSTKLYFGTNTPIRHSRHVIRRRTPMSYDRMVEIADLDRARRDAARDIQRDTKASPAEWAAYAEYANNRRR